MNSFYNPMSIIYSMIAKYNGAILSHYYKHKGNFHEIATSLVRKMPENGRNSWPTKGYVFHAFAQGGIICITMVEESVAKDKSFRFLEDLMEQFKEKYTMDQLIRSQSFSVKFETEIRMLMAKYNNSTEENVTVDVTKAAS